MRVVLIQAKITKKGCTKLFQIYPIKLRLYFEREKNWHFFEKLWA